MLWTRNLLGLEEQDCLFGGQLVTSGLDARVLDVLGELGKDLMAGHFS
jgi:hypothetical protein